MLLPEPGSSWNAVSDHCSLALVHAASGTIEGTLRALSTPWCSATSPSHWTARAFSLQWSIRHFPMENPAFFPLLFFSYSQTLSSPAQQGKATVFIAILWANSSGGWRTCIGTIGQHAWEFVAFFSCLQSAHILAIVWESSFPYVCLSPDVVMW